MSDSKIVQITGKAIVIPGDDIDTDRIIPARFLKEITFANLGKYPFFGERFDVELKQKPHPFNDPNCRDAKILLVNKNFGCGSSREHAPQSLKRWGIDAIVGESFAEIFASNCITLGIPAVTVASESIRAFQAATLEDVNLIWTVNLENSTVASAVASAELHMPEHHKDTLRKGLWDSTSLLLENVEQVRQLYDQLPYTNNYGS